MFQERPDENQMWHYNGYQTWGSTNNQVLLKIWCHEKKNTDEEDQLWCSQRSNIKSCLKKKVLDEDDQKKACKQNPRVDDNRYLTKNSVKKGEITPIIHN